MLMYRVNCYHDLDNKLQESDKAVKRVCVCVCVCVCVTSVAVA